MTPTRQRKNPVKRAFSGVVGRQPDATPVAEKPGIPVVTGQPIELVYCLKHSQRLPCPTCRLTNWVETETVKHQENIQQQAADEWRKVVEFSGIRPDQKCVHGMYLAERYCEVCRFEPIDPSYNPETYRIEISKALSYASFVLRGDEGRKDLKDLHQLVDIEIWKTTKKYADKMTAALAYTIAKNQARGFLVDRIEEQTVLVVDGDGNPVLDEFGQAEGLDGAELKRKSEDLNATPEERQEAKKLLERYARRVPRFSSLDDKPEATVENPLPSSPAELEINRRQLEGRAGDWLQAFLRKGGGPALQRLIATWHGEKRRVAEAMLQPGFTVRNVSGVSKSSVARIRQAVLVAFRAFITQDLKDSQK